MVLLGHAANLAIIAAGGTDRRGLPFAGTSDVEVQADAVTADRPARDKAQAFQPAPHIGGKEIGHWPDSRIRRQAPGRRGPGPR